MVFWSQRCICCFQVCTNVKQWVGCWKKEVTLDAMIYDSIFIDFIQYILQIANFINSQQHQYFYFLPFYCFIIALKCSHFEEVFILFSDNNNMQSTPFYISKDLIATIQAQEILEKYPNVDVYINELKIVNLNLEVTSHRLIFKSNSHHSLLIKGQVIEEIGISESGFFSKDYFVKMHTRYGKVKLSLKTYNEAKVIIEGMMKKKAWLIINEQKKQDNAMYTGIFNKIKEQNQTIKSQAQQVSTSFESFDKLFGNLRQIKSIMASMKQSSGQNDGDNPEVNKILKDMGFVSVISKDESGQNFYRDLAKDLYQVCQNTLFKNFGGMVSLLDLFYFYNKKRQLNLLAPEEVLKACQLFPQLGLQAKIARYSNNITMIESTSFDPDKDFQQNYAKYFQDWKIGYSSQQIARRKGIPVLIVDIKFKNYSRSGKLAVSDRIQGIKYYKNFLLAA